MYIKKIAGLLLLLAGIVHSAPFQGEVYQINKYSKSITCRGPDLSMLKDGQTLYICDENNKQVATVKVTRFYTTVIETTLVTGDVSGIQVKMPVYQDQSQFANKTPLTVVKYEKDYGSYSWKVRLKYRIEGATSFSNLVGSVLRINKVVWIWAEGSDAKVLVDSDKIKALRVRYVDGRYVVVAVKTEAYGEIPVKYCDIMIDPQVIPDSTLQVNDFIKKNFTKENLSGIDLLVKAEGYDEEVGRASEVTVPQRSSTQPVQPMKRRRQ